MRKHHVPALLAGLLLLAAGCGRAGETSQQSGTTPGAEGVSAGAQEATTAAIEYATRSNEGVVMFQARPVGMKEGRFIVDLRVTTHSGDLNELDLQKNARLEIGDRSLKPVEPVRLQGHHAGGTLRFDVSKVMGAFRLVFSDVRDMAPVVFQWP